MVRPKGAELSEIGPHGIELKFNKSSMRVLLRLSNAAWSVSETPPASLIERAERKLSQGVERGELAFFITYAKRLQDAWQALRARPKTDDESLVITLTIAAGAPELSGLILTEPETRNHLVNLSIKADAADVRHWRPDWISLHIEKFLRDRNRAERANTAQVAGALLRAATGIPVTNLGITSLERQVASSQDGEGMRVILNRARREVSLVFHHLRGLQDRPRLDKRLREIGEKISKMDSGSQGSYHIFENQIHKQITRALQGVESLGIEMPFAILAALKLPEASSHRTVLQSQLHSQASHERPPSAGPPSAVEFEVSPDRMTAKIGRINSKLLPDRATMNAQWLRHEAKKIGIVYGLTDDALNAICQKILNGDPVEGLRIADGKQPAPGSYPYLVDVYSGLEAPESDLRRYQRLGAVAAGQLVAEVRYEKLPVNGVNVLGEKIEPADSQEDLGIKVGEGIEMRGQGSYFATHDGVFVNDPKDGLLLHKALIHEGDVNLSTGDISFDGPVEVTGDIDHGARVFAGGDLIVRGEIRGATVTVKGNLVVARGIVLGPSGRVFVSGDVTADFIENSTLSCQGNLSVARSILGSTIVCAGSIEVSSSEGVLAGGTITCGKSLTTAKLGLGNGAKTYIHVGVDTCVEMQLMRRRDRHNQLTAKFAAERNIITELTRKSPAQLTKAHKEQKASLHARTPKWKRILESSERLLVACETQISDQRPDAKLYITGAVSTNCIVKVGQVNVPINNEMSSVMISSSPNEMGQHIQPYSAKASTPDKHSKAS